MKNKIEKDFCNISIELQREIYLISEEDIILLVH